MSDEQRKQLEEQKAMQEMQEKLKEEHQMTFTKGELLVIFNVLTRKEFTYGDFFAIFPVIKKIEPIVVVDSNIQNVGKRAEEAEANHKAGLIGVEEESN